MYVTVAALQECLFDFKTLYINVSTISLIYVHLTALVLNSLVTRVHDDVYDDPLLKLLSLRLHYVF
jgi:hypothetical protein